jgi:uncharacterized membrane protein
MTDVSKVETGPTRGPGRRAECAVCKRSKRLSDLVPASILRPQLALRIAERVPGWSAESFICHADLARFRADYVQDLLQQELGDVDRLERSIVERIARHETLSANTDTELAKDRSLGQRLADRVASFGGSWTFISIFAALLVAWMALNTALLASRAFDPFPYILLNLALSCLAAVQAPIIMMSQKRQEARDRARAQNDYLVNLKAKLEIRHLHEKLDHLLREQWERLTEIQQVQIELMSDLERRKR